MADVKHTHGCVTCAKPHGFQWTDTHGVGVCYHCGTPYTIFHYDPETKTRLDKEPTCALNELGLTLAQRYWAEKQRMVWPGSMDMGFCDGSSYSGATREDESAFYDWLEQQPEVKAATVGAARATEGGV